MPLEQVDHPLSRPLRDQLDRLAAGHRVSLDAVVTAGWAVVVGRHTGADQVSVGRVGPVRLEWDQPVAAWLAGLPAPAAADVPPPAGRSPLESVAVGLGPREPVLQARFEPALMAREQVTLLLGQLEAALASLVTATVVDDVDPLPAAERAELAARAVPRACYPPEPAGLLPGRFVGWATRAPERVAVCHGDQQVSYGDLLARVARLAHRLRGLGVGPGALVGICLPRGVDLVTAVLATACAGGAYLPVDRGDPAARLRSLLADSNAAALVTERAVGDALAALPPGAAVPAAVVLDDPAETAGLAHLPERPPPLAATVDDPAYVIYTSGSTGAPKGVVVEHAQLIRLFDATAQWFEFGPQDVWTLFHSIAFDFSVWELWGALGHGGRLVVVPRQTARDPGEFRRLLLEQHVTVLNQTPASFGNLIKADLAATTAPSPYALRQVIFGGERLDPASLRPWLERYGDQRPRLANMYGITETTVHVTYRPITVADLARAGSSPIGTPIPDLAVRLVDARGRLVPVGVPGEIEVTGAGLARGYLNRAELTAQRFVEERGLGGPRRWYRTGDLARWLPEGELEYLGRLDDQVKVRGYRIELGEIESVLSGHPRVRQAAVALRPSGTPGHRRLMAYLVPAEATTLQWQELRDWLGQRLPEHMLPAGMVSLDRLPLTPNGKLDRAALPDPAPARTDPEQAAPLGAQERLLAEVISEVLGLEGVARTDNFFALGGDSILAIQVAARARARGLAVTPAQLFSHQSVAELATVATAVSDARIEAEQGEVTGEVPPSPAQAWFYGLALPHPGQWPLAVLVMARRRVRVEWLARALAALASQHDLLRMRVTLDGPATDRDQPRQRILPVDSHGPVPVREVDLGSVPPSQLDTRIHELAASASEPADLARGPLLRAVVLRAPAGEPDRVLLEAHHLVVDTVSWQLLLSDLDTAYRQVAAGEPVTLPPKTTGFARWTRQLAELARSDGIATQARWWLTRLPRQIPSLPVDGDPAAPNLEGDRELVEASLDPATTHTLLTSANLAYRTRADELLLAALVRAFAAWTGSPGLLLDLEGHGRDIPVPGADVSRTVGWFTTIFPAWLDLAGVDLTDPARLIKTVKEQVRATPGRGMPYFLARWLRQDPLARQLAELPAAQVSFNHLGRLDPAATSHSEFTLAPEPVRSGRHPANPRAHLIEVVTGFADGRLRLYLAYSAHQHDRATIEGVAQRYLAALRELVAHCTAPGAGGATPSDFPLAQVDQAQLDTLEAGHGPLADLYPLTPLQRGMLFHTLANPHSGVYFEQFSIGMEGELEPAALAQAWDALHRRHEVLRAAVAWQGLAAAHLVIRQRVESPLHHHDWRGLAAGTQEARLEDLLAAERTTGFDLGSAPLTRLHLIRLDQERWNLVWSHHHILLDRWSVAQVIQEVFDTYQAIRAGRYEPAPAPRPFRDYLAYLAGLDLHGAPAYWRRTLSGLSEPTPLGAGQPPVRGGRRDADYARRGRRLSAAQSETVRAFARAHRVTLDTILHGAWALLLAHRSGRDDVLFAVTSSGRPAELAGVEEMIGLFTNTLPARVRVNRAEPVADWLAGLLRDQARAREFEHTPLELIRGWSAIGGEQPLFETARALVNFPWDGSRYRTGDVRITGLRTFEQASHAATFLVVPDPSLELNLWYDALRFDPATAEYLLETVAKLVVGLATDARRPVGTLLAELAAGPQPAQPAPPGSAGSAGSAGAAGSAGSPGPARTAGSAGAATRHAPATTGGPDLVRLADQLRELPAVREAALLPTAEPPGVTAHVAVQAGVLDGGGDLVERLGAAHVARWQASGQARPPVGADRFRWLLGGSGAPGVLVIGGSSELLPDLLDGRAAGTAGDGFDLVVLDRIVAHLPGPVHLARLIDAALSLTTPEGALLLHQVPMWGLRRAAQLADSLGEAADPLPIEALDTQVSQALTRDEALLVDPAYFTALAADDPRLAAAAALVPPGPTRAAGARFGYDAVLWRTAPEPPEAVQWYDWQRDLLSPAELEWLLEQADGDAVGISGAPHAGVAADLEAARLLAGAADLATTGQLRQAAAKVAPGVDPADLYELAGRLGWSLTVAWAAEPGNLDLLFRRGNGTRPGPVNPPPTDLPADVPLLPGSDDAPEAPRGRLTSRPLYGALVAEVTRQAREILAGYGGVTTVVVGDALPPAGGRPPEAAASPVSTSAASTAPVPPQTPTERLLAGVWAQVLGVATVDVRASFFDLGGDSMLAIRLVDEASRVLRRPVPLALLLQQPTLAEMAAALAERAAPWSPLVEINPGEGTPFFCAHPTGGTVLSYRELGRLVGRRAFYALQARGVDDHEAPDDDLPTMAARYLEAVRDRQPAGPYLLGGWSMGGLVAYEMAQQLCAAGERVGLLVLIDTPTPELIDHPPDPAAAMARLLEGVVPIDLAALRAMPVAHRLRHVLAEAERVGRVPPGVDPRRAEEMFAAYSAHLSALRRYHARPYGGPVRLLRAVDSGVSAPDYGWSGLLTGQWRIVDVPGDHESMLWPPQVARLAQVLREQLDAAGQH